ncbi:hypothetical protein [Vulcanisaeta distributa]|uniref:hypothetical protein n=1 Tax=Vulcanisaeta distributa TaxID=164451 RepID=UPI001FB3868A|nr:hypothetical protein [Vulcanisaeta distributa]
MEEGGNLGVHTEWLPIGGVVVATIVNALFLTYMGQTAFNAYGWRIYMGTGAIVAVLAFIIRSSSLSRRCGQGPG